MPRILFDNNTPWRLRLPLTALGMEVVSAKHMGWATKTNGDLLDLAGRHPLGFAAMLTMDKNMRPQQESKRHDSCECS